ncbi:hypothetical protein NL676_032975 [Syzygium grande]|nr:hypothetical protein NL676_032975 [Syzygium grande]
MKVSLAYSIVLSLVLITFFTCAWKVLCLFWLNPKKLERCLRRQGLNGTSYGLLFEDVRDNMTMSKEAQSQPITPFSNDIAPRLLPFLHHSIKKYGKLSFTWFGPTPVLSIMDSDMLTEIFSRINEFEKPHPKAIGDLFVSGLIMIQGEKWVKHRNIINLAFHYEKLKFVVSATCSSCEEMFREWNKQSLAGEVDVWPELQHLTGDVLCKAAFGVTYSQVKRIVPLQQEQMGLTNKILQFAFIPGWSLLPTKMQRRMKEIDHKVSMILNEVLRLYPPGFMTMRAVHKTTKLGDIQIPPGVVLLLPVILIHHDPEIWGDDAKEFNPERFSEGVSKATQNKLCFLPFSWGPRSCIGQNFSLVEAKVALTLILQNFSVRLSPSYKHAPTPMLTIHPQYGVPLILTKIGSNSSVRI